MNYDVIMAGKIKEKYEKQEDKNGRNNENIDVVEYKKRETEMSVENELRSVLTQLREFYMNPPGASKMLRVFVIIDRLKYCLLNLKDQTHK